MVAAVYGEFERMTDFGRDLPRYSQSPTLCDWSLQLEWFASVYLSSSIIVQYAWHIAFQ